MMAGRGALCDEPQRRGRETSRTAQRGPGGSVMASVPLIPLGLFVTGLVVGTFGVVSLAYRLPAARHVAVGAGEAGGDAGPEPDRGRSREASSSDAGNDGPRTVTGSWNASGSDSDAGSESEPNGGPAVGSGADAADAGQLVTVQGETAVEPGVGTTTTPFGGRGALVVEYEVQTPVDSGGDVPSATDEDAWAASHRGATARRFVLADETGSVSVDPGDEVDLGGGWDEVVVVGPDEEPPERVRRFTEEAAGFEPVERGPIGTRPPRRYVERAISPGDEVLVYGEARPRENAPVGEVPDREVVEPGGLGVFHLSRGSAPSTEGTLGGGAALGVGIAFTVLGAASLLGLL